MIASSTYGPTYAALRHYSTTFDLSFKLVRSHTIGIRKRKLKKGKSADEPDSTTPIYRSPLAPAANKPHSAIGHPPLHHPGWRPYLGSSQTGNLLRIKKKGARKKITNKKEFCMERSHTWREAHTWKGVIYGKRYSQKYGQK